MYSIIEPRRKMSVPEMALGLSGLWLTIWSLGEHAATYSRPFRIVATFVGLGMLASAAAINARQKRKAERDAHPPPT